MQNGDAANASPRIDDMIEQAEELRRQQLGELKTPSPGQINAPRDWLGEIRCPRRVDGARVVACRNDSLGHRDGAN